MTLPALRFTAQSIHLESNKVQNTQKILQQLSESLMKFDSLLHPVETAQSFIKNLASPNERIFDGVLGSLSLH